MACPLQAAFPQGSLRQPCSSCFSASNLSIATSVFSSSSSSLSCLSSRVGAMAHLSGRIPEMQKRRPVSAFCSSDSHSTVETRTVRIHYHRDDEDYESWGLHVWGDTITTTSWQNPLPPMGCDEYGLYWDVLIKSSGNVDLIVHKGDMKDNVSAMPISTHEHFWLISGNAEVFVEMPQYRHTVKGSLKFAQAYWVKKDLLAWPLDMDNAQFYLYASRNASLFLSRKGVDGADAVVKLEKDSEGLPSEVVQKFPHIKGYLALRVPSLCDARELVKCQVGVAVFNGNNWLWGCSSFNLKYISKHKWMGNLSSN